MNMTVLPGAQGWGRGGGTWALLRPQCLVLIALMEEAFPSGHHAEAGELGSPG